MEERLDAMLAVLEDIKDLSLEEFRNARCSLKPTPKGKRKRTLADSVESSAKRSRPPPDVTVLLEGALMELKTRLPGTYVTEEKVGVDLPLSLSCGDENRSQQNAFQEDEKSQENESLENESRKNESRKNESLENESLENESLENEFRKKESWENDSVLAANASRECEHVVTMGQFRPAPARGLLKRQSTPNKDAFSIFDPPSLGSSLHQSPNPSPPSSHCESRSSNASPCDVKVEGSTPDLAEFNTAKVEADESPPVAKVATDIHDTKLPQTTSRHTSAQSSPTNKPEAVFSGLKARTLPRHLGLRVVESVTERTAVVVVPDTGALRTLKSLTAQLLGVPMVGISEIQRLPQVSELTPSRPPPLFQGLHFHIIGPLGRTSPSARQIAELVVLGGGSLSLPESQPLYLIMENDCRRMRQSTSGRRCLRLEPRKLVDWIICQTQPALEEVTFDDSMMK